MYARTNGFFSQATCFIDKILVGKEIIYTKMYNLYWDFFKII